MNQSSKMCQLKNNFKESQTNKLRKKNAELWLAAKVLLKNLHSLVSDEASLEYG